MRGERRRELAQIGGRRADQARELTEAPVGRRKRHLLARQHQRQPLGVVAAGLHPDRRALGGPGPAALGAAAHRRRRARTGTGTARPPAGRTIPRTRGRSARRGSHPPCSRHASLRAASRTFSWVMGYLHDGRREPLSPAFNPSRTLVQTLTLWRAQREAQSRSASAPQGQKKIARAISALSASMRHARKWYGKRKMRVLPWGADGFT